MQSTTPLLHRVTLMATWDADVVPRFPQVPRVIVRVDGAWMITFDVEGDSFDSAAGRLWGEAAACGLTVLAVDRDQPAA